MITKKALLKRIHKLEEELGYVYDIDEEGFASHVKTDSYGAITRLLKRVGELEDEVEELREKKK